MTDKTKEELIEQIRLLQKRITELEAADSECKKAQEQVQASQIQLSYLTRYANDLIILLDDQFCFLETNEQVVDSYGYTREELIGMHATQLRAPETKALFTEQVKPLLVTDRVVYETVHQRKDGTKFPVEISLRAICIKGKKLYHAVIRDITEHKKAEEALRTSEKRFRVFFEQSKDAIFVADPQTRMLVDCNSQAEKLTGRSKEEILSMHADDLHPKDVLDETISLFKRQVAGEDILAESIVLAKDGRRVPISINTARVELDGKLLLIGIFRDITDYKRLEELSRQNEEEYRTLIENIDIGIYRNIVGPPGKFIKVNAAHLDILGYDSVEEFLKVDARDLYQDPAERDLFLKEIQEKGFVRNKELHLKKKDGTPITVAITSKARYDNEGKIKWIDGAIEDITERKQIEQALNDRERLLHQMGDIAKIGGWEMDLATGKATWTKGTYDIVEIEYGKPIPGFYEHIEYYLPEYREMVRKKMNTLVETQQPMEFEVMLETARGNRKWCKAVCEAVVENGKTVRLRGTFQDLTERKKVEDALRESEKRFMDVLYASKDAILLIDGNKFTDCNEATARMLGYSSRNEFLMTHPSQLSPPIQPDGRHSFEKAEEMMKIASEKGFNRFEWMHRKASGEDFPVEVSLTPVAIGGKNIIHCVWRDITDRKKIEENIKKSIEDLQHFKSVTLGREERMIELKKEINRLSKELGRGEPYEIPV
ncbi:MAG TPA: PAS domain S-box protein [Candidatus Omnitrophota bacterium]|nr:PAS domain S-box protein [Candidatus Omnitrophota bacterium]HPD84736.1 PAS domain S-box protein [Candidatus Omnitrophota bacterium]HRZ03594.1 PAS domain S-box protein [Candidatus Omnitrophota bacterium]